MEISGGGAPEKHVSLLAPRAVVALRLGEAQAQLLGWATDGSFPSCTTTGDYLLFKTKAALNPAPFVALTTKLLPKLQLENSSLSFFETSSTYS